MGSWFLFLPLCPHSTAAHIEPIWHLIRLLLLISLLLLSPQEMEFAATSLSQHQAQTMTEPWKQTLLLAFQSLGVVFGQLSIGPLFVFHTAAVDEIESKEMLYGLMSFIFWTMTLIPFIKYVFIVLRADDNGEGGTFALYSLLCRHAKVGMLPNSLIEDDDLCLCKDSVESKDKISVEKNKKSHYMMWFMAVLGSCTVIVCGVLVPTISVLMASKDLDRSLEDLLFQSQKRRDKFGDYTEIPIACAIIIPLFVLQHYGTHKIGFLFAPIIIVWLLFISGLGIYNIFHWDRYVIAALSPRYMFKLLQNLNIINWRSLGGVLLCTAGSEAMFADLGHFSKRSIKVAFSLLVYPSLILCYMGQTAYISKNWKTGVQDVTHLSTTVPGGLRHIYPWICLLAAAVGSQAAITATFSIIKQCLALDCLPRMKVVHTSSKIHGQVYIPDVNRILMALSLVFIFASRNIALIRYAIGLAINTGMLITTCFMSLIIALLWNKKLLAVCFLLLFGSIEAIYFVGCILNIEKGAWILVVLVEILLIIVLSWHYGVMKKYQFDMQNKVSIDWLTSLGPSLGVARVPGIGFVCTEITKGIPSFFSHFVANLPAFHEVLIFVSFKSVPVPQVPSSMQLLIGRMGPKEYRVYRCIVRYGYRDRIGDVNEFEDQIIHGIGEFISQDDGNSEAMCWSPEARVVVSGRVHAGSALIAVAATDSHATCERIEDIECQKVQTGELPLARKRRVQFMLPPESPKMTLAVREELQELLDAREHGTTYVLGKSHFCARRGSNFLRRFMVGVYVFLSKNCREPSMVLNIPNAAHVEVGISYTI